MTFKNGMRPVHPGEVLREEYLKPLGLSANALAKALRLSPSRRSVLRKRSALREIALSTQQHEQMFPRKRIFTTILEIRCKLWIYNEKVGRLGTAFAL
jgi:hypothetical protein